MTGMPSKVNGHAAIQPPNTCPPDSRLTVELKRDLDLLPEDAAALNALVESRPEMGVFVSTAWLSGYFADPPDGSEPSLALLRQGRALRGVVPIAVRRKRWIGAGSAWPSMSGSAISAGAIPAPPGSGSSV